MLVPMPLGHSHLTVVIDQDVVHLDPPLTNPDFASPWPVPHLDYSAIAAANSLGSIQ